MNRHQPRRAVTEAAAHHSLKAHAMRNLESELARVSRSAFFVASYFKDPKTLYIAKECRKASRALARRRRAYMAENPASKDSS